MRFRPATRCPPAFADEAMWRCLGPHDGVRAEASHGHSRYRSLVTPKRMFPFTYDTGHTMTEGAALHELANLEELSRSTPAVAGRDACRRLAGSRRIRGSRSGW